MSDWELWFAWHPVQLRNGKYAWLRTVCRRWNNDLNPWADISGYSGTDGGWEYM